MFLFEIRMKVIKTLSLSSKLLSHTKVSHSHSSSSSIILLLIIIIIDNNNILIILRLRSLFVGVLS